MHSTIYSAEVGRPVVWAVECEVRATRRRGRKVGSGNIARRQTSSKDDPNFWSEAGRYLNENCKATATAQYTRPADHPRRRCGRSHDIPPVRARPNLVFKQVPWAAVPLDGAKVRCVESWRADNEERGSRQHLTLDEPDCSPEQTGACAYALNIKDLIHEGHVKPCQTTNNKRDQRLIEVASVENIGAE